MRLRAAPVALAVVFAVPASANDGVFRSSAFLTNQLRGEQTVIDFGENLEKISVFAYHITESGDVLPASSWVPDVTRWLVANAPGRTILVTINNRVLNSDGTLSQLHSGETVYAILADPEKRSRHIRRLAEVGATADGLELNYERLPPETRPLFTDFVRDLRLALRPDKKLSLVLQAKTDNTIGDRGRAVDWRAVEPYADTMRVMAYYYAYSTSAHGPVVSMSQLSALADYILHDRDQGIPIHKASVILSLWGWDWPSPVGTPGTLVTYSQAMKIATDHGVTPVRHPQEGTLHFKYTGTGGVEHEVWIDDFQSIHQRIDLLHNLGMPRIELWHLNTGEAALWPFVRSHTMACGGPLRGTALAEALDRLDVTLFPPPNGGGPCSTIDGR